MAEESEAEARRDAGKARRRKRAGSARPARSAQHWMIVSSPENFRKTRDHGFSAQGVKDRHRKRVETMRPGDRLLFYITGRMAFAATATVTSPVYEDHTMIWRSVRWEEDYPWRVRLRPDVVLEDIDWVSAKELAYRLDYVRKWAPESWSLAFQGHLHQLAQKDFKLVEDELRRVHRTRRSEPARATT
ncbi:MAG TPA: EVE domain-containing protein [Candidatus Dormibacteraeota bacterium]